MRAGVGLAIAAGLVFVGFATSALGDDARSIPPGGRACEAAADAPDAATQDEGLRLCQRELDAGVGGDAYLSGIHGRMGGIYLRKGDLFRAGSELDASLRLNPTDPYALITRSIVRRKTGDLKGAIVDATTAVQTYPRSTAARVERATALDMRGDPASLEFALNDVRTALQLKPHDPYLMLRAGPVLLDGGKYDEAVAVGTDLLQSSPLDGYVIRAEAYAHLRKDEAAIADAGAAEHVAPGNARVAMLRCDVYEFAGKLDRARHECEGALKRAPDRASAASALVKLCEVELAAKHYAAALKASDKAVAADPKLLAAYRLRSQARAKLGDAKGAKADLARVDEIQAAWSTAYKGPMVVKREDRHN